MFYVEIENLCCVLKAKPREWPITTSVFGQGKLDFVDRFFFALATVLAKLIGNIPDVLSSRESQYSHFNLDFFH